MFGWAEKLFTGYSSAELQAESDRADERLREQNRLALERGAITGDVYRATEENIYAGRIDASGEIQGAFNEGLQEGVDNVRTTIGDVVTSPLRLIDWRIWILGAVALFIYMGGAARLKGALRK